jgi:glycosyltransferase involved in cell wall biosynthesis
MLNKNIKFTVVIPTCNRADTLKWALKSCVNQDYENLEIIVSDNFSQDQTLDVVSSFQDQRIKYINPGQRLGMSSHWEFALQQATGDYINFIGDDDAMLPNAYNNLSRIIHKLNCQVLSWTKDDFVYFWPRTEHPNLLSVSLWNSPNIVELDSQDILDKVQSFKANYGSLPMIYSGIVSRQLINKITSYCGTFFTSAIPDVYSGVAIACELNSFHRSGTPYSITGCSSHSIGNSTLNGEKGDPNPGVNFYRENDRLFHKNIASSPLNIEMCVSDCILIARDNLISSKNLTIDFTSLMKTIIKHGFQCSPLKYQEYVLAVRKIGELNNLSGVAEEIINNLPNKPSKPKSVNLLSRTNSIGTVAYLNCEDLGIENVYDAANLVSSILMLHQADCLSFVGKIRNFINSVFKKKYNL